MATSANSDLVFHEMVEADLPAVVAIEEQAYADPWSLPIFSNSLRAGYQGWCLQGLPSSSQTSLALLGYALLAVQHDEGHILNLCVTPTEQGRGLGKMLLRHLIDWAAAAGLASLLLEVRASNRAAIALYCGFGFVELGKRIDYYPAAGGRDSEDALVFALKLH